MTGQRHYRRGAAIRIHPFADGWKALAVERHAASAKFLPMPSPGMSAME